MAKKHEIGKSRRESIGLSANKMAELVGCSSSTIYNYEDGKDVRQPIVTAYWTVLERLTNEMSQVERKVAELKSRIATLSPNDRADVMIANLTSIIRVSSDLIFEVNEKEKRIRLNATQSSLSSLTSVRR